MDAARLAAIPLFADLGEEDLAALASSASELEVGAGEQIATEGDFGHALYAIESGSADVSVAGEHVRTLGAGDVFGEIAVLASGRRTATVVTTEPTRLIALFKRDVWSLESRAPDTAERLRALIADRLATDER